MTDREEAAARRALMPGLDHIANFLNALDTEGMTPRQVRSAVYRECIDPTQFRTDRKDGHE